MPEESPYEPRRWWVGLLRKASAAVIGLAILSVLYQAAVSTSIGFGRWIEIAIGNGRLGLTLTSPPIPSGGFDVRARLQPGISASPEGTIIRRSILSTKIPFVATLGPLSCVVLLATSKRTVRPQYCRCGYRTCEVPGTTCPECGQPRTQPA